MPVVERVFEEDSDLAIKDELLSIHSMFPFVRECSSSRCHMASTHLSQALALEFGDEKIVQTGLEKQFGKNTFCVKAEEDLVVRKIIKRYSGIDTNSINKTVETLYIVENIKTNEIDYISVPYYHKLDKSFGFVYKKNEDVLNSLRPSDPLPEGTILAYPPSLTKNFGYKMGVNSNLCLMNIPETTEDGVVISERLSEKLSYDVFEERHIEFGTDSFPLNLYGDENNYKAFPELGEMVNENSALMALRKYDVNKAPALTSRNDVKEFNPLFDKVVYVKAPGEKVTICGKEFLSGEIVDIKVYYNPKYKKDMYSNVIDGIDRYANSLRKYYQDILDTYEELKKEHYKLYKNNNVKVSEKFHRLILEAMALINPTKKKIFYSYKNEIMDIVRISFVVRYKFKANIPAKLSDSWGSKGVIVQVRKNEDMPYTIVNGEKITADIIMDPASLVSRMNVGRLYEQYFNAISRKTQYEIRKAMGGIKDMDTYSKKELDTGWKILLGLLEIIGTEQYVEYSKVSDINIKKQILNECLTEEVYILYKVSSPKRPYQIVLEVKGTIYEPEINHVHIPTPNGEIVTKNKILIAPTYNIMLSKIGDTYLSVAGAKLNHFGFPIGVSSATRDDLPYRSSPTKTLSETETRLYLSYVGREAIAELKSRANNIDVHRELYNNILNADIPTNIDTLYDRDKYGYTQDASMELINNIFNSAGIDIVSMDGKE